MKVIIAGGGTAGHVSPAVALAHALERHDVVFVGTARGAEGKLVPGAGYPLRTIDISGFDRGRPFTVVPTALRAAGAVFFALRLLRDENPDVVVGMGGYVSLPVCLAAWMRQIPVLLHEQNIVLGLANRLCRPIARKVAVSFRETLADAGGQGVLVGNPVSPDLATMDRDRERAHALVRFGLDHGRKTLLVFGGSQGARRINDSAVGVVRLWTDRRDRQLLHITGSRSERASAERLTPEALVYRRVTFVERMLEAYAAADVAVCRGGASTVAEITVAGVPAVIVPYPYHRDRQQELQARVLEHAGAAVVIADSDATPERVASECDRLLSDDKRLEAMRRAALSLGRPEAARVLARVVEEVARLRHGSAEGGVGSPSGWNWGSDA